MNFRLIAIIASIVTFASLAPAQAPWPMERQDRWGTARAPVGPDPSTYTNPWVVQSFMNGIVSAAPILDADGNGYYGTWVTNHVVKFNWQTATFLQQFTAPGFCTSSPVLGPSPFIYPVAGGKLLALDTGIMDYQWFYNVGGNDGTDYDHGSAVVGPDGTVVFGGNSGIVYRFPSGSPIPVWTRTGLGNMFHTPCFSRDDSKVFVSNGNHVTALDFATGSIVWDVNLGTEAGAPGTAPDGVVVVGSGSGTIYGIDPASHAILWTWSALSGIRAAPAFDAFGNAYLCSYDQRLYSIRTSDGHRNWSYTASATAMTSPIVGPDNRIYFSVRSGDIYCIGTAGNLIWQRHLNGEPRGGMSLGPDGTIFANAWGSPNSGMVMIRQTGYGLPMDSYSIERGSLLGGSLDSLRATDGSSMTFRRGVTQIITEQPVRVVFTAHTNYRPLDQFAIKLTTGVSTPGLEQAVELFNFQTGLYETVDTRPATMSNSTIRIQELSTFSSANRFVQSSDGQIRIRIGFRALGATYSQQWTARFDQLTLEGVTPTFQAPPG